MSSQLDMFAEQRLEDLYEDTTPEKWGCCPWTDEQGKTCFGGWGGWYGPSRDLWECHRCHRWWKAPKRIRRVLR